MAERTIAWLAAKSNPCLHYRGAHEDKGWFLLRAAALSLQPPVSLRPDNEQGRVLASK
jgi:hypothetical protein